MCIIWAWVWYGHVYTGVIWYGKGVVIGMVLVWCEYGMDGADKDFF